MDAFKLDDIEKRYGDSLVSDPCKPALSNEDIRSLVFAMRNYRKMALWMADVLAASAWPLLSRKSTSRSERSRQVSILNRAREMLVNEYGGHERTARREDVIRRIDEILKEEAQRA